MSVLAALSCPTGELSTQLGFRAADSLRNIEPGGAASKRNQRGSMTVSDQLPSVNYHLWKPCNMRCEFCFATFLDIEPTVLPKDTWGVRAAWP